MDVFVRCAELLPEIRDVSDFAKFRFVGRKSFHIYNMMSKDIASEK